MKVVVGLVATVAGTALLLVGLLWMAFIGFSASTYCERGDSNYGTLSWSTLPPGPVCTWSEGPIRAAETTGPTPVMSMWILVMGALAVIAVGAFRSADAAAERRQRQPT